MILLLNQTEPDDSGAFGSVGKEKGGGFIVQFLEGLRQSFYRARQLDCWLGEKPGETWGLMAY